MGEYKMSLKTYTKVVGGFSLAFCFICCSIAIMVFSREMVSSVEQSLHDDGWGKNMDRDTIATGIFIFGMVMLVGSIVGIVISACLIHGARTTNACLMKPWIVSTGITMVLDIFFIIFALNKLPAQVVSGICYLTSAAYSLKIVRLHMAEVEEGTGLKRYIDHRGRLLFKNEDGEVVLE